MRVVSLAKRLAILADCDAGSGTGKVAAKHGVSGTFDLKKERRETGTLRGPHKRGKGRKPKIDRIRVQELVAADADATPCSTRSVPATPTASTATAAMQQSKIENAPMFADFVMRAIQNVELQLDRCQPVTELHLLAGKRKPRNPGVL